MKPIIIEPSITLHKTHVNLVPVMGACALEQVRFLCNDKERNDLILNVIAADLEQGRKILIPFSSLDSVAMSENLKSLINLRLDSSQMVCDRLYASQSVAERKIAMNKFVNGETRVLICSEALIGAGFNLQGWDTYYKITPTVDRFIRGVVRPVTLRVFVDTNPAPPVLPRFKKVIAGYSAVGYPLDIGSLPFFNEMNGEV